MSTMVKFHRYFIYFNFKVESGHMLYYMKMGFTIYIIIISEG